MKNLKVVFIAAVLGFVLMTSQPAVIAATNSTTSSFTLDQATGFDPSTSDFSVEVLSVGPNVLENATLEDDNTYHIVSDDLFTLVRFRVAFSGYTMISNGSMDVAYGGQLFVINNGVANVVGAAYSGSAGVDIPMDSQTNTITFLYIGWDETDGYVYASDTVVVRIGAVAEDLANAGFEAVEVPVTSSATDTVDTTATYDAAEFIASNWYSVYSKNELVEPTLDDLELAYTDASGDTFDIGYNTGQISIPLDDENLGSFDIGGTYDTTGFLGPQAKGINYTKVLLNYYDADGQDLMPAYDGDATHPVESGLAFLTDGDGLTLLGDATTATMYTSEEGRSASSVGVVAISGSGYWDLAQAVYGGGIDWDSVFSSTFDASTGEGIYGTVDIGINTLVGSFGAAIPAADATETIDSPGFTALLSLGSVAVIAYLAPRFRKEE